MAQDKARIRFSFVTQEGMNDIERKDFQSRLSSLLHIPRFHSIEVTAADPKEEIKDDTAIRLTYEGDFYYRAKDKGYLGGVDFDRRGRDSKSFIDIIMSVKDVCHKVKITIEENDQDLGGIVRWNEDSDNIIRYDNVPIALSPEERRLIIETLEQDVKEDNASPLLESILSRFKRAEFKIDRKWKT